MMTTTGWFIVLEILCLCRGAQVAVVVVRSDSGSVIALPLGEHRQGDHDEKGRKRQELTFCLKPVR